MVATDDELWVQLDAITAMDLLSLSDRSPHQYCDPPIHFQDEKRTAKAPGNGPFYVVTKGLQEGIYDHWCVAVMVECSLR